MGAWGRSEWGCSLSWIILDSLFAVRNPIPSTSVKRRICWKHNETAQPRHWITGDGPISLLIQSPLHSLWGRGPPLTALVPLSIYSATFESGWPEGSPWPVLAGSICIPGPITTAKWLGNHDGPSLGCSPLLGSKEWGLFSEEREGGRANARHTLWCNLQ